MIDDYKMKDMLALITAELAYVDLAESIAARHQRSNLLCKFQEFCAINYSTNPVRNGDREINDLYLSVRACNVLYKLNIYTIKEAREVTDIQLKSVEGCGKKTVKEIRLALGKPS